MCGRVGAELLVWGVWARGRVGAWTRGRVDAWACVRASIGARWQSLNSIQLHMISILKLKCQVRRNKCNTVQ